MKILQLLPVNDVYLKCEDGYYDKAIALAFVEMEGVQTVTYLFRGDIEHPIDGNSLAVGDKIVFKEEILAMEPPDIFEKQVAAGWNFNFSHHDNMEK